MRWSSLSGIILSGVWSAWWFLLAFRVVGKRPGQDPKFDAWMEHWSGTFKVMGVIGIIGMVLEAVTIIVDF